MSEQTSLLDLKEEAINRVAEHANTEWMAEAREAVEVLCRRKREFTTDDVWRLMTLVNIQTADNRAMGAVMRWAAHTRLARPTGYYRPSTRPACNRRPIAVWMPL